MGVFEDINRGGSRRDVLKSIGAAGVLGLGASGAASALREADDVRQVGDVRTDVTPDRTVRVEASGRAEYTLAVTGLLSATNAPSTAVGGGTASAALTDGVHEFAFSGEFTELSVNGDAQVFVDGEPFDVETFPHNTLEIVPDGRASYDVSASGAVVVEQGTADQPNARTATGEAARRTVLSYAGELTYVDVDGDATLRRNGSTVGVDDVLPSTLPHEFTAVARSSGAYVIDVSQAVETADGTVVGEPTELTGRTTARYAGSVSAVEHPSGARIELNSGRNEVVFRAPDDGGAQFAVETERGLVVAHEAYDVVEFSLSAGETATATPFGDLTRVAIDDLEMQFETGAHSAATESAKLQTAAELERTDAYRRLADVAAGRVRHDAAGIAVQELVSADRSVATTSVEYRLAEPRRGDRGILSIERTNRGVENAAARYEHLEDGAAVAVDAVILPTDGDPSTDRLRREHTELPQRYRQMGEGQASEREAYGAELFASSMAPKPLSETDLGEYEQQLTEEQLSDEGFLGFLDDIKGLLQDIGAPVVDAAEFVWGIVKDDLGSIAITGLNLLIEAPFLLVDFLIALKDTGIRWKHKLVYKLAVGPAIGLADLAFAGFFDELGDDWECAGCIFVGVLVREGVIAGVSAGCSFLGFAAVACYAALPIILDFVSSVTPFGDVKDELCDGALIDEINYC